MTVQKDFLSKLDRPALEDEQRLPQGLCEWTYMNDAHMRSSCKISEQCDSFIQKVIEKGICERPTVDTNHMKNMFVASHGETAIKQLERVQSISFKKYELVHLKRVGLRQQPNDKQQKFFTARHDAIVKDRFYVKQLYCLFDKSKTASDSHETRLSKVQELLVQLEKGFS